jgi:hypothetical protein
MGNEAQNAVYRNRRRIRGDRDKRLLRQRGELLKRPYVICTKPGCCDVYTCGAEHREESCYTRRR